MSTHHRLSFVVTLLVTTLAAGQETDSWTPELALRVKPVSNVRVSPDGTLVAYEVGVARMDEERSDYLTHIHVATADGSRRYQLTRGDESCSDARWSPDGAWIAFTSSRGGEKPNLFRIGVHGGEAERLTDVETGVGAFEWSPDGTRIAFLMTDADEEQETRKKEKRDARVVDEDLKMSHLHVVPADPDEHGAREVKRITEGGFTISGGFFGGAFSWHPDGTEIAFAHTVSPKVDDWPTSDISIVDVESGDVRAVVDTRAAETSPVFSPDGALIAFTASDDPPSWGFTGYVYVVDADGGPPRGLARTPGLQPGILGFSETGQDVVVVEATRTRRQLYRLPLRARSGPLAIGEPEMFGSVSLNRERTHFGFAIESTAEPPEAFVSDAGSIRPSRVSDVQDLPDAPLGKTEVITWSSSDGREVEGLLTYPVGYVEGTRVPLLVIVHGGPAGVFQERFIGRRGAYPIAAFASRGYAVLRANPRGSSGYGRDFRYANYGDWGGGDYRDIMTGVDHVVGLGVADESRMGIMGWSYGGFMTSWVVTQTDRFKAASVGAGVTNLMSFTGTADIPSFIPDYFGGEFWNDIESWAAHSAMFNVKGVSTPTLIQHGEQDLRVPVSQGYELYNALKRQNVPTKMVVYPRQPHGIREPKLQLDAMQRNLDWFDEWVKGGSAGPS